MKDRIDAAQAKSWRNKATSHIIWGVTLFGGAEQKLD
jgi:hypothetical protein